jgi:nucleotide-binding universal stress UspA family protein
MKINKVLVPLDTSALSEQALPAAAKIARRLDAEVHLVLAHDEEPAAGYPDAPWNAARTGMERTYLDDQARDLARRYGVRVVAEHARGDPGESVIAAVRRGADLVVMATHGRTGLSRLWHGSITDRVTRATPTPVLMLRASPSKASAEREAANAFARVVIALDGSTEAERSIEAALALAGTTASYVLVRAVTPVPLALPNVDGYVAVSALPVDTEATEALAREAREYLSRVAKGLTDREIKVEAQRVGIVHDPAALLLDVAREWQADLIALASHQRDTSRFILGSVVDELLNNSRIPLLVCHRSAAPLGSLTRASDGGEHAAAP